MSAPLCSCDTYGGSGMKNICSQAAEQSRTITNLRKQVEKLTKERDALVNAIDNEMVVTHMGVFNLGDDPKVALNKICCYAQDLGKFFAEDACKEQLAALAAQNEKFRETLSRWRYQNLSYNWCCGNCGAVDGDEHKEGCALSLPDLASPVLNRIRAEGMRISTEIHECEDVLAPVGNSVWGEAYQQGWIDGTAKYRDVIHARAAELEKSNG